MVKRFIIALVAVVVVCGGLIGFNLFRAKMISDFFAGMQMPAATVSATEVAATTWTPEIDAIGTLLAVQGVDVASELAGVVRIIEFQANEEVEEGDLLVQIDDAVERADLVSAQAELARDQAQLERVTALRETGVSSEQTLETAQTDLATSQSNLARIQAVIDQKAIRRPSPARSAFRASMSASMFSLARSSRRCSNSPRCAPTSPFRSSASARCRWARRRASA